VPSEATNEATRREWRELGFFYGRDDEAKVWHIAGSKQGPATFARLIQRYVSNPRNEALSEHDHLGPYMYLTIGTWSAPEITNYWIAGPLKDLSHLSSIINDKLCELKCGDQMTLRPAFAPTSPYDLVLEMRDDEFDPARADRNCW
jgi:hypothetical protein